MPLPRYRCPDVFCCAVCATASRLSSPAILDSDFPPEEK
jgi:hypothetical protein